MENSIYSGREALLLWCQQQTYKYVPKVSIKDFTTSWQDGYAFCALVHRIEPSSFNFSSLDKLDARQRMELAFECAEKLGIIGVLSPTHVLENPDEASIITYVTQFYFNFPVILDQNYKNKNDNQTSSEKLEKLRKLILESVEDIQLHLFDIELLLEFIQTVEKIPEFKPLIRQIINMAQKLNEFDIPQTETNAFVPKVQNPNLHPKLLKFQKEIELLFWEIRSKFYELTSQTIRTKSVSLLVYYGKLLKQIKLIIRETEEKQKLLIIDKRQREQKYHQQLQSRKLSDQDLMKGSSSFLVGSPPPVRGPSTPDEKSRKRIAMSSSTEDMLNIIEKTSKSQPQNPNPHKKIMRDTLQKLDTLLENDQVQEVNTLLETNSEFQSFFNILSSRITDDKTRSKERTEEKDNQLQQKKELRESKRENPLSFSSESENESSVERRKTTDKFQDTSELTFLLDLPCVLDEDVPTLINITAKAEGIDLDAKSPSSNSFLEPGTTKNNTISVNNNNNTINPNNEPKSTNSTPLSSSPTSSSLNEATYSCTRCGASSKQPWRFCGVCGHSYDNLKSQQISVGASGRNLSDDDSKFFSPPTFKLGERIEESSKSMIISESTHAKLLKSRSFTKFVMQEGYLFKLSEKRKVWKRKFFSLTSEMLTIYLTEKKDKRRGCILLESITEIKTASNFAKKIFGFQIVSEAKTIYLYSNSEVGTQEWIQTISLLCKQSKENLAKMVSKTEPDGNIVLNVLIASLQESKRIKFPATTTVQEAKSLIIKKFQSSFSPGSSSLPTNIDSFDIWIIKNGRWADDPKRPISTYVNTRDVIELKSKNKASEPIKLEGYLMKRDPSGLIKGWKRRFFQLNELKLYYALSESNLKDIHKPIGFIDLRESYQVQFLPQVADDVFSISIPSRTYLLKADSIAEAKYWVSGLNELKGRRDIDNFWIRKYQTTHREGYLFKRGGRVKTWKRRWCVMMDGFLHYHKEKTSGGRETRGSIALYNSRVEISNEIPSQLAFQIITAKRIYLMYAETDQETKEWMDAIRKHKIELEQKIASIKIKSK